MKEFAGIAVTSWSFWGCAETGSVFCRNAPWECFGDPTVFAWRYVHHIWCFWQKETAAVLVSQTNPESWTFIFGKKISLVATNVHSCWLNMLHWLFRGCARNGVKIPFQKSILVVWDSTYLVSMTQPHKTLINKSSHLYFCYYVFLLSLPVNGFHRLSRLRQSLKILAYNSHHFEFLLKQIKQLNN